MKAHLAKLSLALLSTVFLLGCQDLGSEPVGPEGPQFDKAGSGTCDKATDKTHPAYPGHCHDGDEGTSDGSANGGRKSVDVNFRDDTGEDSNDPTLVSTSVSNGGYTILPIQPTGSPSDSIMVFAIIDLRVKGGNIVSIKLWLNSREDTNEGYWRTPVLPVDPPVPTSSAPVTVHLHADGVSLTREKGTLLLGFISIEDLFVTSTQ